MEQSLVFLGLVVVFIGIIIIIIGSLIGMEKGEVKFGFGGFIGPFPIGFATEKNMLYLIIAVVVVMFLLFLLFGHR